MTRVLYKSNINVETEKKIFNQWLHVAIFISETNNYYLGQYCLTYTWESSFWGRLLQQLEKRGISQRVVIHNTENTSQQAANIEASEAVLNKITDSCCDTNHHDGAWSGSLEKLGEVRQNRIVSVKLLSLVITHSYMRDFVILWSKCYHHQCCGRDQWDVTNHVITFSVKVVKSLAEDEGRLIDNPKITDIQRHLYDLVWQAVRDKVGGDNIE